MRAAVAHLLPSEQSSERLAALAGQGHESAFSALVDRHSTALLAFARKTAGPDLAEDVLQQSLMQAWSSLQSGIEVQHVRGWLFQIVRRVAWAASQGAPCSELPLTLASADDLHARTEQRMQLQRVVEQVGHLPEHQRLALVQTAMEGRSRAEVAATLGVTEGAVRQLLHRGRERVRAAAAAVVPFPLLNWIMRHGRPDGVQQADAAPAAAIGTIAGVAKAVAVLVSVGAVAAGAGAEIKHLGSGRHAQGPASEAQSAAAATPRLLAELFAAPAGSAGSTASGAGLQGVGPLSNVLFGGPGGGAVPGGFAPLGLFDPSASPVARLGTDPGADAPGADQGGAPGATDGGSATGAPGGSAPVSSGSADHASSPAEQHQHAADGATPDGAPAGDSPANGSDAAAPHTASDGSPSTTPADPPAADPAAPATEPPPATVYTTPADPAPADPPADPGS
jgi:RNA polymerase sigma factor (sigma-70 family)